jgi:hypothetical protein
MLGDRPCVNVLYWDKNWEELEELRVEDATFEEAAAALETADLAMSYAGRCGAGSLLQELGVARVTLEVSYES